MSPSVYAIIESFTASNGCSTIGRAFSAFTASFDPGEVSTYAAGGVPAVFNFSDMPCGPDNNASDAEPYWPYIVAPPSLFEQMGGGYNDCRLNSWPDPSITLVPGAADGPFGSPPLHPGRHRRAPAPADRLPQAPERTSEPTRNAV